MVLKKGVIGIIILLLLTSLGVAQDDSQTDCIYYFYGEDCTDCQDIDLYLTKLQERYPNLDVNRYEAYYNRENARTLVNYFESYNVGKESRGVPVVFIGDSYLIGAKPVLGLLEGRIIDNEDVACPAFENQLTAGVVGNSIPSNVITTFNIVRVSGAALQSSFKPAMIGLLLLLLSLSVLTEDKRLRKGLLFVLGASATYLLYGLDVLPSFTSSQVPFFFAKGMGVIAIISGMKVMKGFMKPAKKEEKDKFDWVTSTAGFFGLGLISASFTLGQTSDVLPLLRALFTDASLRLSVLPFLVYYTAVVAVPFVALVLGFFYIQKNLHQKAVVKGEKSDRKIQAWKKHYDGILHFSAGAVLVIGGLVLLIV